VVTIRSAKPPGKSAGTLKAMAVGETEISEAAVPPIVTLTPLSSYVLLGGATSVTDVIGLDVADESAALPFGRRFTPLLPSGRTSG